MDIRNVCWICLSPDNLLGLTPINSKTKTVLADLFEVHVDDESLICAECFGFLEKVLKFQEKAKSSLNQIRQVIEMKRERSVSLESGSGSSDDSSSRISYDESSESGSGSDTDESETEEKTSSGESEASSNSSVEHKERNLSIKPNRKSNRFWFCNCCNMITWDGVKHHYKTVHKDLTKNEIKKLRTQCNICGKTCTLAGNLFDHKKRAHPELFEKPVECNVCGIKLPSSQAMKRHKKSKHSKIVQKDELKYAPTYKKNQGWKCCGKIYATKCTLNKHKTLKHRSAIRQTPCLCYYCNQLFKSLFELRLHHKIAHNDLTGEEKKKLSLKCRICDKQFNNIHNAMYHKKKFHPEMFKIKN